MVAREVFEVLYSPVKAFKKIVEKPDFKGVLLILVLVMFLMVVARYATVSKLFLEKAMPDEDEWTESTALWTFNKNGVGSNDTDRVVGNYSVKCFVPNGTSVWMRTTRIGQFNCSEDDGYKSLSFRIKWIHQNETPPSSNATLRLFSSSESHYFELNLVHDISNSSNEWYNVTDPISIGPESQGWISFGSPDWKNITGLEFRLNWLDPDAANLTMKIDDLYFGKYVPSLETGAFSGIIISTLMSAATFFFMNWILWGGILLLTVRVFHEKGGPWTTFFIVIGHVFIVTAVWALASVALLSALPALNLPLNVDAADALLQERWYSHWAYQLVFYLLFLMHVWTAVLCAIAIGFLCKTERKKVARIAVVAFLLRIALMLLLVGF